MDKCYLCDSHFDCKRSLFDHIKQIHRSARNYMCFFENCNRSYTKIDSFIAHVTRKHTVPELKKSNNDSQKSNLYMIDQPLINDQDQYLATDNDCDNECDGYDGYYDGWEDFDHYSQPNIDHLGDDYLDSLAIQYVAYINKNQNLNRRTVQNIINSTQNISEKIANYIAKEMDVSSFEEKEKTKLLLILNRCANFLKSFNSEQKCLTRFKALKTYVEPKSIVIGQRMEFKKHAIFQSIHHVPVTIQHIPLGKVLKLFFELPNVFNETMSYLNKLNKNTEIISNFVQGNYWKTRSIEFNGKVVVPIIFYSDDYENNNALGSHKGVAKTGAGYINIPCLPVSYQSKLENIFVYLLFNTIDRTVFGNEIVFSHMLDELINLQKVGISLDLPEGLTNVFFELVLTTGDNLGQHSLLGFTESFNATIFCDKCLTKKNDICNVLSEKNCELRDEVNYKNLLASGNPKQSGIKHECVFHKLNNFHVTRNIAVDAMHDILEGVARYDMARILYHLIYEKKMFSLDDLNFRLRAFDYGFKNSVNKPQPICESHIKNGYIVMSSSEMMCFLNNFSLIVGHYVPESNDYWKLYLILRNIVTIVWSADVHKDLHIYLGVIIEEYLTLLLTLVPNGMKPKHHFLIHYPRCMYQFGPLCKICCLRNEAKHKVGKDVSKSTTSRININRTVAIKHQMMLNYRFINQNSTSSAIVCGKRITLPNISFITDYQKFNSLNLKQVKNITTVKWIEMNGNRILINAILVLFSEEGPKFYIVSEIILEENTFVILTRQFLDCYFDPHFVAYKIFDSNDVEFTVLNLKDIETCKVTHVTMLSNGYYYIPKSWV